MLGGMVSMKGMIVFSTKIIFEDLNSKTSFFFGIFLKSFQPKKQLIIGIFIDF